MGSAVGVDVGVGFGGLPGPSPFPGPARAEPLTAIPITSTSPTKVTLLRFLDADVSNMTISSLIELGLHLMGVKTLGTDVPTEGTFRAFVSGLNSSP